MELTDTSLNITQQEAGVLADFLRDFDGLNDRGFHGDKISAEEYRLRSRLATIAVYKLVAPDFNQRIFESSDILEVPRKHLPEMQKVIDARLMNPASAVEEGCEGAYGHDKYGREDVFRKLAWLSQVYEALDGVNSTPHYPVDILNKRFSSIELPHEDLYEDEYDGGFDYEDEAKERIAWY